MPLSRMRLGSYNASRPEGLMQVGRRLAYSL